MHNVIIQLSSTFITYTICWQFQINPNIYKQVKMRTEGRKSRRMIKSHTSIWWGLRFSVTSDLRRLGIRLGQASWAAGGQSRFSVRGPRPLPVGRCATGEAHPRRWRKGCDLPAHSVQDAVNHGSRLRPPPHSPRRSFPWPAVFPRPGNKSQGPETRVPAGARISLSTMVILAPSPSTRSQSGHRRPVNLKTYTPAVSTQPIKVRDAGYVTHTQGGAARRRRASVGISLPGISARCSNYGGWHFHTLSLPAFKKTREFRSFCPLGNVTSP